MRYYVSRPKQHKHEHSKQCPRVPCFCRVVVGGKVERCHRVSSLSLLAKGGRSLKTCFPFLLGGAPPPRLRDPGPEGLRALLRQQGRSLLLPQPVGGDLLLLPMTSVLYFFVVAVVIAAFSTGTTVLAGGYRVVIRVFLVMSPLPPLLLYAAYIDRGLRRGVKPPNILHGRCSCCRVFCWCGYVVVVVVFGVFLRLPPLPPLSCLLPAT